MAKEGTVTNVDTQNFKISIRSGEYVNEYPYNYPYGKHENGVASWMKYPPKVGDVVEYTVGKDGGTWYLKFIKTIGKGDGGSGGQPTSNPLQFNSQSNQSSKPSYSNKSYDSPEKQQRIYRQHAEKLFAEFYSENPEFLDTRDGALTIDVAFIEQVTANAEIMVQRFCLKYGLSYVDHTGN